MFRKLITAIFTVSILLGANIAGAEIVNINKADAAALAENLDGIGPVKSKAIVNYRRKNGKFKSLDDLTNVDGVGEELVKTNRKNMSLTRGATKATGKPKTTSKPAAKKSKAKKSTKAASGSKAKKSTKKKVTKKKTTAKKGKKVKKTKSSKQKKK